MLADLCLVSIHLFACSRSLVVAGYYYYHHLSDNQQWLCTKVGEQAACHWAGLPAGTDNSFRPNTYVYILYLRCEDAISAILCMGVPITANIVDIWLKSLMLHDDNKCITDKD